MKRISILVPESSVMQTIADPQQLFSDTNQYLMSQGKPPLFDVELVGARKVVSINNGKFLVRTDKLLKNVRKTDLIFIPAITGNMPAAIKKNEPLVSWIIQHYHKGAEVASLCVGAFLLASTGLLDGKKCSTHWVVQNEFREMYPNVELVDGSIVTEEKRIYSSGGSYSYWNLLLHLLEKYVNRETAILASKYFAIDISRNSQSVFSMFKGQKNHGDEEILTAQEFVEKNIHERITIDDLAELTATGRRTFERRFKHATGNSVLEYIHRVKIEAAKRQLEISKKNIGEVMYELGYTDTHAFRELFKRIAGFTPLEYRCRYNKATN